MGQNSFYLYSAEGGSFKMQEEDTLEILNKNRAKYTAGKIVTFLRKGGFSLEKASVFFEKREL